MAEQQIGFWATLAGLIGVIVGPPLAVIKSTVATKKDLERNNMIRDKGRAACQDAIHQALEEIKETQTKQTKYILTIVRKLDIKKDDIHEMEL